MIQRRTNDVVDITRVKRNAAADNHRHLTPVLLIVFAISLLHCGSALAASPEKCFYAYVNLHSDEQRAGDATNFSTDQLLAILPRLEAEGYDAIVLASYELQNLKFLDPANPDETAQAVQCRIRKIRDLAKECCIEVIPEVMPVGPSASILVNNLNLAEGTPVRDCVFRVYRDGDRLIAAPEQNNLVSHGDFDFAADSDSATWEDVLETWNLAPDAPELSQSDDAPTGSTQSLKINFAKKPEAHPVEFGKDIDLRPWTQYRLTFSIKTENLRFQSGVASPEFYARVSGKIPGYGFRDLERANHEIGADQEWTAYSVVLNSHDAKAGKLWVGIGGATSGTAKVSGIGLEMVGGANLLRRDDDPTTDGLCEALPISVRIQGQDTALKECDDFERWEDSFIAEDKQFRHDHPGTALRILSSSIEEGQELAVSYYHASLPDSQTQYVCVSLRHPSVDAMFRQQVERINAILEPKRWLINHDEVRSAGHDPLAKGDSPHVMLGECMKRCLEIVEEVAPGDEAMVFSDMYDPTHNAVCANNPDSYFPFVKGSFAGSWRYLPPGITILNWQLGSSSYTEQNLADWVCSLQHFDEEVKAKQVVLGFYDSVDGKTESDKRKDAFNKALIRFSLAKCNANVTAVCYYTTKRNDQYTAAFANAADRVWPNTQDTTD